MSRRLCFLTCVIVALVALVPSGALARSGRTRPPVVNPTRPRIKTPVVTPTSPLTRGSTYLALGDSVTFGYQESTTRPAPDYFNASTFVGYPEMIAKQLHVTVANPACPGETSGSLISVSIPSNGCENGYRKIYPLHVRYRGSQLSYAVSFLRSHPGVRLVSLMIGANDAFLCEEHTADHCASPSERQATARQISGNVRRILQTIRVNARYRGQLAILNYYSTDYSSPSSNAGTLLIDQALDSAAKPFHVEYASGYNEFQAASVKYADKPCLAGLITQLNGVTGDCGVHPTYAGQALLAAALLKAIRL